MILIVLLFVKDVNPTVICVVLQMFSTVFNAFMVIDFTVIIKVHHVYNVQQNTAYNA